MMVAASAVTLVFYTILVLREKVEEKKNENCNYWGWEGWS